MSKLPPCPACQSEYTYEDVGIYACPECGHTWHPAATGSDIDETPAATDAYGNRLHDGDNVTVIKDLEVKGASSVVKVGTKVRNIRIVDGDHNIDSKVDGIGPMKLKSEFVRKA